MEHFGPWDLIRKIGQGGMAEVFLARDRDKGEQARPVVVKRLLSEMESDSTAVDLFITEADVMLLLSHPNVVQVFDAGEIDGRYFMVMEYVNGRDLRAIMNRYEQVGGLPEPAIAIHIITEVLRGLDYIHNAKAQSGRPLGIVHRDITPSNVFISSAGEVKIGDFGVAKLSGIEGWTMVGSMKGKLRYLSPEQIAGTTPTAAFDLWATAVSFYELLSGEKPFAAATELDIMVNIKSAKLPALAKFNPLVDRKLNKIAMRALQRKESKRYANAAQWLSDLEKYADKHGHIMTGARLLTAMREALT